MNRAITAAKASRGLMIWFCTIIPDDPDYGTEWHAVCYCDPGHVSGLVYDWITNGTHPPTLTDMRRADWHGPTCRVTSTEDKYHENV